MTKKKNANRQRNASAKPKTTAVGRRAGIRKKRAVRKRACPLSQIARRAFDAFHPAHVPHPVPTAPYMMVTTRKTISTSELGILIGSMDVTQSDYMGGTPEWSNSVALSFNDPAAHMGGVMATKYAIPTPTTDRDDFETVPASVSFQVTATDSLTTATGAVYIGKLKSCLNAPEMNDSRSVDNFFDNVLGFSNPKTMSVAKLAMTAQQVNLTPGNSTEVGDFRSMQVDSATSPYMWFNDATSPDGKYEFAGFKPGYIYNPNRRPLLITIAVQWKLRLSPFNPMHSSMSHYPPSHPGAWHKLIGAADSVAHGVEDVGVVGAAGYLASGAAAETGIMGAMGEAMTSIGAALPSIMEAAPLLLL